MASKPSIEKTPLEFSFEIHSVQFNHLGGYFLRLAVQSSFTREYGHLGVQRSDGEWKQDYEIKTETLEQKSANEFNHPEGLKYSFFLPKGFCKNDSKHDVYLLVEAFEAKSNRRRVGEAKYGIYPRTNAPKANLYAPLGEDMYHATDYMTILRTLSTENLQMHCGRLKYTARLKRVAKPPRELGGEITPTPEPVSAEPTPRVPTFPTEIPPTPSKEDGEEVVDDSFLTPTPRQSRMSPHGEKKEFVHDELNIPDSPETLDGDIPSKKVQESPSSSKKDQTDNMQRQHHVSLAPDKETISVMLHVADNLPVLPDGTLPTPFCICKTKSMEKLNKKATAVSSATDQPTQRPTWTDTLSVQVDSSRIESEELILTIADKGSKTALATYRLPISYLEPFHQYHLDMVLPLKNAPSGVRLLASVTRRQHVLPKHLSSPNYTALEVTLNGVKQQLVNPAGPLIAVGRVVQDLTSYPLDDEIPHAARTVERGLDVITVRFPATYSQFKIKSQHYHGHPQVSQPGVPPEQPEWNHSYLFCNSRDKATLFTPGATLILEFYEASAYLGKMAWTAKRPVAHAILHLDQSAYKQLINDNASQGLRVEGLPLQGTDLRTVDQKTPTLGCILRLITSERPCLLTLEDDLPVFKMTHPEDCPGSMTLVKVGDDEDQEEEDEEVSNPWWKWSDLRLTSAASSAKSIEEGPTYALQRKLKPPVLVSHQPSSESDELV